MLVAMEKLGVLLAAEQAAELRGPDGVRLESLTGLERVGFPALRQPRLVRRADRDPVQPRPGPRPRRPRGSGRPGAGRVTGRPPDRERHAAVRGRTGRSLTGQAAYASLIAWLSSCMR
ncbi:hypothetical protein ABZ860_41010 [Microbispora sp. NPDC046973]|uniref:hypothetical protein n=1 Tax=Microbispora sp. NPDC046973 TaxID=3155022 RepID=UPI0033EED3F4